MPVCDRLKERGLLRGPVLPSPLEHVVRRPGGEPAYHVLLVEDNPQDARLAQAHLASMRGFSHRLQVEGSLQAALAALAKGDVDVVLLDLGLPDSQGLNTLSRIISQHRDVPVVVLTGHDDEQTAIAAARMGAQDYVVKGRTQGVLQHILRYAIERHAILRGRPSPAPRGVQA